MIGLAYHLDNFTICQVYEAIGHVIATVETPFARMALIRDTHAVSFLMARVRDGGIPCGSCNMLDSSHKRHPVKKAAIEASTRVSQAAHKQVLLEISDDPRILTPWCAMQPCSTRGAQVHDGGVTTDSAACVLLYEDFNGRWHSTERSGIIKLVPVAQQRFTQNMKAWTIAGQLLQGIRPDTPRYAKT